MSVIAMERGGSRKKPPPTLTTNFGHDAGYLEMVARWHVLRAQQQIAWTKHELATGWGTLPDEGIKLSLDSLNKMKTIEDDLALITPKTALLAREMLGICITILSHPRPAEFLGQGPVLEIVENVQAAFDHMPSEKRFKEPASDAADSSEDPGEPQT